MIGNYKHLAPTARPRIAARELRNAKLGATYLRLTIYDLLTALMIGFDRSAFVAPASAGTIKM